MSVIQKFWGKELRPGEVETMQSTSQSLTICGASISDSSVAARTTADSSSPPQLLLTLKSGSERYLDFPICTFIPGTVEYVHLHITIPLKERVRIEARGRHAIFVYGNLTEASSGVSTISSTKRTAEFEVDALPQAKRIRSDRLGIESIDLTSDVSNTQPVGVAGSSKKPPGETARGENRGPAQSRLSDPIAARQFVKTAAFDFEVSTKDNEAKSGQVVSPSNQNTSSAPSTSGLTAMNGNLGSPSSVLSAWVDNEQIDVEEFVAGEGNPCQPGCMVELQYVVSNNTTQEYLVKNSEGEVEARSLTFTVGDKSIPAVLNCAVYKASLNAERSLVIPQGMLGKNMSLPFPTDEEIRFEFQVAGIKWIKAEEQGAGKKPVSP